MHVLRELRCPIKWTMVACNEYPQRFHDARELGMQMSLEKGLTHAQTLEQLRYHLIIGDMSKMF